MGSEPDGTPIMMQDHLCRMARYNRWANDRLHAAIEQLPRNVYHQPRQAFFGSIHGTLNHLLVGDEVWLSRFERQPTPDVKLDDQPFSDLKALRAARSAMDERIIALADSYDAAEIGQTIRYRMITLPDEIEMPLAICWMHLFNHQTHHRGQIHDQLSQTDVPPPSIDLIYYVIETGNAV